MLRFYEKGDTESFFFFSKLYLPQSNLCSSETPLQSLVALRVARMWPILHQPSFMPFRRRQESGQVGSVCVCTKTRAAYTFVTFQCGDVPTFYAKFLWTLQHQLSFRLSKWLLRFLTNSGCHLRVILPGWSCSNSSASPKVPIKIQYHMCVHLHVSGDACFHLTVLFLVCLYNKAFLITTQPLASCVGVLLV